MSWRGAPHRFVRHRSGENRQGSRRSPAPYNASSFISALIRTTVKDSTTPLAPASLSGQRHAECRRAYPGRRYRGGVARRTSTLIRTNPGAGRARFAATCNPAPHWLQSGNRAALRQAGASPRARKGSDPGPPPPLARNRERPHTGAYRNPADRGAVLDRLPVGRARLECRRGTCAAARRPLRAIFSVWRGNCLVSVLHVRLQRRRTVNDTELLLPRVVEHVRLRQDS